MSRARWIVALCLLVAVAYAALKIPVVYEFWFQGVNAWSALFRPFPDWGTDPDLYGALLPAKWIGTRTMWYAGALLAVTFFAALFGAYKLIAFYLLEGALVELMDLFWLADGKYGWGWTTSATDQAMVKAFLTAIVLLLCGAYLFRRDSRPWFGEIVPVSGRVGDEFMSPQFFRYFTWWCYFVAVAFAGMKALFAYWWCFDGIWFWSAAFRPFPDWGTGADLFGALLPAKWICTRNLAYALIILAGVVASASAGMHRLLGFVLLQGVLIEFFDGLWLINGKFNVGWSGPGTTFYGYGGFAWFPFLLTAGIFMLSKARLESTSALRPTKGN